MAHRTCEDCGTSMQPFVRRTRRDDGSLVCKACMPEDKGGRRGGGRPEATPRGYRSPQYWESAKTAMPFDDDVQWATGPAPNPGSVWENPETSFHDPNDRYYIMDSEAAVLGGPNGPWIGSRSEGLAKIEDLRGAYPNRRHMLIPATGKQVEWLGGRGGRPGHFIMKLPDYEGSRTSTRLPDRFEPLFEGRRKVADAVWTPHPKTPWLMVCPYCSAEFRGVSAEAAESKAQEHERRAHPDVARAREGRRKHAHDSGDGETLYHCPFCGAGQLVGNADGTAQCQFCNTTFTVQVQPNQPEMPQTVDGEPYPIPDMPGTPGGGESGLPPPPVEEETPVTPKEEEQQPPQFATSSGHRLSEDDYIAHLALRHARNREATLKAIRAQRGR